MANPKPGTDPVRLGRLRFAQTVRTALVAGLDTSGADDGRGRVWFDRKRLEPGDEWELDIVGALHDCEAAVLLLTPDALESPWVLREATVLADRRSRWPELRLVPVLLAGVRHESLTQHPWWAALDITRWQPVQALHGAFEGADADSDLASIVDQVVAKLADLAKPRDPALEGWTDEVRAFLADLQTRGLKRRLDGAAKVLRLKRPLRWDHTALDSLARALLQSDVAELDDAGAPRYPLLLALDQLVPDDPGLRPRETAERSLCQRLQPLAAPPAAAVAVGSLRAALAGARPPSVLLRANDVRLARLAVRRATCDDVRVTALTGVFGEAPELPADVIVNLEAFAARAARIRKPVYVVATLHPGAGDDLDAMAQALARQLPIQAALVGVIGRDPGATAAPPGGTVVVVVPADDERAALVVANDLDYLAGAA